MRPLLVEVQALVSTSPLWFQNGFGEIHVKQFMKEKLGENLWLVILALSPIPFTLFNNYSSGIFLGKNQISIFNKINWIPNLVILFITTILVLWFCLGISGYLIALIGGPLYISFILFFKNKFIQAFSLNYNWRIIRQMLSLGLVYAVALLVINLNYRIDVILLDNLSTSYDFICHLVILCLKHKLQILKNLYLLNN